MKVVKEYARYKKVKSIIKRHFPLVRVSICEKCGDHYITEPMFKIITSENYYRVSFDAYCKYCFPNKASLIKYIMDNDKYLRLTK